MQLEMQHLDSYHIFGSATQVMMHCSNGWNTKSHQCDSLRIWRRTRFYGLTETLVALRYYWIAQCSWFFPSLCPPPDDACSVERLHMPPKSQCRQSHIGDRAAAKIAITCEQPLRRVHQCKHLQSHECWHRAPTRPTACFPCCSQMTTVHHIGSLVSPFFGCHLHLAGHLPIFLVDVGL